MDRVVMFPKVDVLFHFRYWSGPVEMPTYTRSEIEAYSCVADDVACNAAPAVPSPADAWSGMINNA